MEHDNISGYSLWMHSEVVSLDCSFLIAPSAFSNVYLVLMTTDSTLDILVNCEMYSKQPFVIKFVSFWEKSTVFPEYSGLPQQYSWKPRNDYKIDN
jgi:hypothetical protein